MDEEVETIESLTEAVSGLIAAVQANGIMLLRVIRTLESLGITISDYDPKLPTQH
jgi:hypothetical protein